jgi:hypothetical protein
VGLVLLVLYIAAVVAFVVVGAFPHLLEPDSANGQGLGEFIEKVNGVKGPATIAMGSLSGVGLALGGGLMAVGQQTGARIMTMSAVAGGGVALGNGVIT